MAEERQSIGDEIPAGCEPDLDPDADAFIVGSAREAPRGVTGAIKGQRPGELLRPGLVICGRVAMWRPLEILLYGWWQIRAEARLYDRLSKVPVRIFYRGTAERDAWRSDWPALAPTPIIAQKSPTHNPSQ